MSASTEHAPIESQNGMPVKDVQSTEDGHRVYIGNLPFSVTEEQVREILAPVGGEILDVTLPLRFGRKPAGYAFVGFKEEEHAKKAIETLNEKEYGDRKLQLQLARSKEESSERRKAAVERREAAKATRHQEAKEKALAQSGDAVDTEAKPQKKRSPRNRRRAPGEEDEAEEGAEAASPATGDSAEKPKRKPRARKPREARIDATAGETAEGGEKKPRERKPRPPRMAATGEQSKNSIFVANLPFNVDDDALAAIFTNLSIKVKSAKVVQGIRRGRPGSKPFRASKGFGFVEVEDPAQQQEAVDKVEGSLIGDRKISAKIANEMVPVAAEAAEADAEAAQPTA